MEIVRDSYCNQFSLMRFQTAAGNNDKVSDTSTDAAETEDSVETLRIARDDQSSIVHLLGQRSKNSQAIRDRILSLQDVGRRIYSVDKRM